MRTIIFTDGRTPGTDYDSKILGESDRAIALASQNFYAYFTKSRYFRLTHRLKEAVRLADVGLAINPHYAAGYGVRAVAEDYLLLFEQTKADIQQAMRLSPRDPMSALWYLVWGDAELGLGNTDTATDLYHKSIDAGWDVYAPYSNLAATYALQGKIEESKANLAEARRLNPRLSIKWLNDTAPPLPALFEGWRKAGMPEE